MYEAAAVNRLIGQMRHLLEQIVAHPARKLSEFQFPNDVGDPLPPFVPRSRYATSPTNRDLAMEDRSILAVSLLENSKSRYTHLGKI